MISRRLDFLRAPGDLHSPTEAAIFVIGSFIIYGLLASLPFFIFFTQIRSLAIGYFLTFLAMLATETFGARRKIYPLKRFQVLGARVILVPFIMATVWQFSGPVLEISGDLETLILANILSIISLNCLLHAWRQQSMGPYHNWDSRLYRTRQYAKWAWADLKKDFVSGNGVLASQARWYFGLAIIITLLGIAKFGFGLF
jgi:hypothetical protein